MYTLYNYTNESYLTHPRVGIWFTEDIKEAQDMLTTCLAYLKEIDFSVDVGIVEIKEPDTFPHRLSSNEEPTKTCQ